jgi:hypothetical protein
VNALARPDTGVVSGMLELTTRSGGATIADRYWRYERWLRNSEARVHSGVGVTGAIYAMRRALWEPLPDGLILDDVYIPMRLALQGWHIGFTDRALAIDERQFAARDEYHRKVRTLTGVVQLCAWLPGVLHPLRNPVWLQFTFHKLLRLLTPYLVALAAIELLPDASLGVARAVGDVPFALAFLGVILWFMPDLRQGLRSQLTWSLALQSSIVVAALNGMRGRWDVWRA